VSEAKGPDASRFAANVRARRELNGMSQGDLAQAMRDLDHGTFRQQTVAEIERGSRAIKLDEALSLSRALGITVDNLLRPAGLTKEASELLDSAREARETHRAALHWAAEHDHAVRRVEQALKRAAGHEAELADEIAVARNTLIEPEP
jgi:transcriptional regulator with XRE-family HTH domain